MASVYGIRKRLEKNSIDKEMIKEITGNGDLISIIEKMEKLLKPEIMHQILDSCACGGGKKFIKRCEKIGKEIAGKTLSEKIEYVNSISDAEKIFLNADNTLTAKWSHVDNGRFRCVCSTVVNKGTKISELALKDSNRVMPLSHCYCCAGSGRRHMQLQLGVKLKTKEIVSTPINSRGDKPCEFIFEIT